MKVGIGFDIHRLVKGRKLTLGGITIPFSLGLKGHSDADALIHATVDAILGAVGLGDIGELFPDTDKRYKDMSSSFFLKEAQKLVQKKGYKIDHIDSIIIAERPKLGPYKQEMSESLARILKCRASQINVKAKTMEGLGDIGLGKAISVHCVAVLKKKR